MVGKNSKEIKLGYLNRFDLNINNVMQSNDTQPANNVTWTYCVLLVVEKDKMYDLKEGYFYCQVNTKPNNCILLYSIYKQIFVAVWVFILKLEV